LLSVDEYPNPCAPLPHSGPKVGLSQGMWNRHNLCCAEDNCCN
jgi:hypothetical protein